ncbi:Histidine kinase [Catalinimonas alkaloidigena]|uniref:histidine kinase n=1 Tax=Catalinimonas alkaloidigena TaxID=1075417 RepID=A0A1G9GI86_9BACT|nr:ATP-binding protein [Catalinimonas alkaloidigena]SDL00388.1 Histidine kinase [Catalinimonas alkaloidigena]
MTRTSSFNPASDNEHLLQREILKTHLEMQAHTFQALTKEIHDNIGQLLSLTRLHVSTIKGATPELFDQKVGTCKALLDRAIEDLRSLSTPLGSAFVAEHTLSESVQAQLETIRKTGVCETSLRVTGQAVDALEASRKLLAFRIVQEALTNVVSHAQATHIVVTIHHTDDGITLTLEDDGEGFEADQLTHRTSPADDTGIGAMQYRAALIQADFSLQSRPGEGTRVYLRIPYPVVS